MLRDAHAAAQHVVGAGTQAHDGILAALEREVVRRDEALDHELDLLDALFRIETVGRELVEVEALHALVGGALEHLRDERDAVALAHAVDAGEYLLRVDRDIDLAHARLAVAAAAAAILRLAAEIADEERAQAFGRVAVVDHALELRKLDALPRRVLGRDVDEVALRHDVLRRVEQQALARLAVAARAPRLLVVGLDVLRHVVVEHVAHVALVDAHAERVRRDDDCEVVVEEIVLHARALLVAESRVVAAGGDVLFREVLVELVDLLARGGVDDACLALVREDVARGEVALLHAAAHLEIEVRPVEARDVHVGLRKREQAHDVLAHLGRRRRGEGGDERAARQRGDEGRDRLVARAEVMAPLGEAVRLVDGDHRDGEP